MYYWILIFTPYVLLNPYLSTPYVLLNIICSLVIFPCLQDLLPYIREPWYVETSIITP